MQHESSPGAVFSQTLSVTLSARDASGAGLHSAPAIPHAAITRSEGDRNRSPTAVAVAYAVAYARSSRMGTLDHVPPRSLTRVAMGGYTPPTTNVPQARRTGGATSSPLVNSIVPATGA